MTSSTSTDQGRATGTADWAICCSGGGIRSAAYSLGALQSLDQRGIVAKARWILGVSGGSYIASSRALVARHLEAGTTPAAYAPGTPEERNLRCDTHYIAPNVPTVLVGVLSLLLGAVATFVIALAPLYAVAHAWGWLLRWRGALVPSGPHAMTAAVTGSAWWLPSVILAGITLVLFGYWWWTLPPDARHPGGALKPYDRDRGDVRAWLVSRAAGLAAALALAMLAVPPLIAWLTRSTGSLGTIAHFLGFGATPSWTLSGLAGVIAAVAAVARYCQAGLAKWTAAGSAARGNSAAPQPGQLGKLAGRARQQLLPWLGSAAVVFLGAILALLWISAGAKQGYSAGQLLPVGIALAVALLARVVVNVNRLSMHDFYRWRLANAFAVTREAAREQNPVRARELFATASAALLSTFPKRKADGGDPGLVICGTANINAEREVPPGQDGCCVSFDAEHVTLHRGGLAAQDKAQALLSDYEALVGQRRATLFDMSAISGAAVSPLMGSATKHAYRILFTAANVCLGVWLPHPSVVRDARSLLDDRPGNWREKHPLRLLCWYLMPHPFWHRDAEKQQRREQRLWAHVLTLRLNGKGALWYRAMQPTLGLLWAEAAGRLSYRGTWMYVTDGGHYDNLGLVEALRRGARNIVVLDASGDKADTWSTLGGAMALARTDAGVEIDLDPSSMTKDEHDLDPSQAHELAPGQVVRPYAHGRFHRLEPVPGLPDEGDIWVCKLGWWTGAPWDVLAYARQHPSYPCDSTLEQLYDASEFEAYHQLGAAAVQDAAENCQPPLRADVLTKV